MINDINSKDIKEIFFDVLRNKIEYQYHKEGRYFKSFNEFAKDYLEKMLLTSDQVSDIASETIRQHEYDRNNS